MINQKPILYSFRRCPYAIRARLALAYAGISVELREVNLKNKPEQMLLISPKGTVPVLQLDDGVVIDESLEIMQWALRQNDPARWLVMDDGVNRLIGQNDREFKYYLDRYKYKDCYPDFPVSHSREKAERFLAILEPRLDRWGHVGGCSRCFADAAIFPFVRQFAAVDENWFANAPYPATRQWLQFWVESHLFAEVMAKYPVWKAV